MELKNRTAAIIRSLYLDVHSYAEYITYEQMYEMETFDLRRRTNFYWMTRSVVDRTIRRAFE